MYWEDGKTTKFKNGTDIALAVVEVTDPIRLAAAMGDLKSQLSKIPEPKPFKGTFRNQKEIAGIKGLVAGYPMDIFYEEKGHLDGGNFA